MLTMAAFVLFTACRSAGPLQKGEPEDQFIRDVTAYPVFNTEGNRISFPFMGGFNAPRPQFSDIDGDGDTDLFVQENTDEVIFFEYAETEEGFPLVWRSNRFLDLSVGEWFRFVDLDQDGDPDLLAEQPYSYIRYYRNEGTAKTPVFVPARDSLRDVTGEPIFSDRQNIPNVTDIDCDGFLDLFIGRLDGTLTRYESVGLDEEDVPQFELITDRFENIEIVQQFGTMHGANSMAFQDIDGDSDQDLFWGDFFEPSILLLENEGSCGDPRFSNEPRPFPLGNPASTSGYNAPTLTDWDNDGDTDLFLGVLGGAYNAIETTAENFLFFEQENGDFTLQSEQFLTMIDIGEESIPAAGDIDGDGDIDILLANKIDPSDRRSSYVYILENRGTVAAPEFHLAGTLNFPDAYHYAPALADMDGDGLDDLILGNWKGNIALYRNSGSGFNLAQETLAELPRGSNAVPVTADLDADEDLDLLVGESGGGLLFFRNTGTPENPGFVLEQDAFSNVEVTHRSAPSLYDIDADGDLDLFLGSKQEGVQFYRNTGNPQEAVFQKEPLPFPMVSTQFITPRFADLNGDGEMELLAGGRSGGVYLYR